MSTPSPRKPCHLLLLEPSSGPESDRFLHAFVSDLYDGPVCLTRKQNKTLDQTTSVFYWPQEFWVTNSPSLHVPVLPTFAPNLPLVLFPFSVVFHEILPSFFFFPWSLLPPYKGKNLFLIFLISTEWNTLMCL